MITALAFLFVIGILVFVHEFGHFIVAKNAGVEVEKFSLGFGPKIIGFKKGDTHYMISAIPLGGYVKMKGENPDEPLTNDPKEFSSRGVGVRAAIISAGPITNIIFAFIIMPLVYFIGIQVPAFLDKAPVAYWVAEESPAKAAGIQIGDRILAINGAEIDNWEMFNLQNTLVSGASELKSDKEVTIRIERDKLLKEKTIIFKKGNSYMGGIGIYHKMNAQIAGIVDGSPAQEAVLEPADIIKEINDTTIVHWVQMSEIITTHPGEEITLKIEREGSLLNYKITPDPTIDSIVKSSSADEAGLQVGDILHSINNEHVSNWKEELSGKGSFKDDELELKATRNGEQFTATVVLKENDAIGMTIAGKIGIMPLAETVLKRYGVLGSVKEGFKRTAAVISLTLLVLKKLVTLNLSVKTLGGPIIIAKMSGAAAKSGIAFLLVFTAFLSINLGVLNLLPIPILDGGHLFFLLIELIMRKPLGVKTMEMIQKVGFALIILLFVTVTYNDIMRIIPLKYLEFLPWK
jgi:regulator of sigma E protease